ncbi:hypothetical protein KCF3NO3_44540 [Chryseobacterium sp. KCF3-3]
MKAGSEKLEAGRNRMEVIIFSYKITFASQVNTEVVSTYQKILDIYKTIKKDLRNKVSLR